MKKIYLLFILLIASSVSFGQRVALTAVIDGTCTGGEPKVVEIYVEGTIDFSVTSYDLVIRSNSNSWNNASGQSLAALGEVTDSFAYLLGVGDTSLFTTEFGAKDHIIELGEVSSNGDDSYRIVEEVSSGVYEVIDQVGGDTDGTGEPWEFLDSYALRVSGTGPDAGFVQANWTFAGRNALDNEGACNSSSALSTIVSLGSLTALPVAKQNIENFSTYPNPVVNGEFMINTANNSVKDVQIYNMLGKQVYAQKIEASQSVDVSNLNTGIYILKVLEEGKTATRKLVIK